MSSYPPAQENRSTGLGSLHSPILGSLTKEILSFLGYACINAALLYLFLTAAQG